MLAFTVQRIILGLQLQTLWVLSPEQNASVNALWLYEHTKIILHTQRVYTPPWAGMRSALLCNLFNALI